MVANLQPKAKLKADGVIPDVNDSTLWRWQKYRGFPPWYYIHGRAYGDVEECLAWRDKNVKRKYMGRETIASKSTEK